MDNILLKGSENLKAFDIDLKYPDLDIWVDCLVIYNHKPNQTFPFHAHPNFELHFVAEGEGEIAFIDNQINPSEIFKIPAKVKSKNDSTLVEYQIKNDSNLVLDNANIAKFKVKEGSAFINPPGQFCWHKSSAENPFKEYLFRFSFNIKKSNQPINSFFLKEYKLIQQLLSQSTFNVFDNVQDIRLIFETIFQEAYYKKPAFLVKIKNEMINLIIAYSRLTWDQHKINYFIPEIQITNRRLEMIDSFILSNIDKNITIGELSSFVNMSERNLCRFVKEHKGISIHQYITQQRINLAIDLIKTKMYTISDIAYFSGFSSVSHLSKSIKKNTGMNPSQL